MAFALIGLYLHIEKGYLSRQVQQAHMKLAAPRKQWSQFKLPLTRGSVRANDVLVLDPGFLRDEMIEKWCSAVWES